MNVSLPNGETHRLIQVTDGGPVQGQRLGVHPADLPGDVPTAGLPALLTLESAGDELRFAVRLVPVVEVPAGVVAIGAEFAAEAGIEDAGGVSRWSVARPLTVPLRGVRLESASEASADEAARALSDAGLPGRLLWVPAHDDELWLNAGELLYRVSHLDGLQQRDVLAEFRQDTEVELFVSGARGGVDMVVLADCSGSMMVPDIPSAGEYAETGPYGLQASRYLSAPPGHRLPKKERAQALRESLHHLVDERRRLRGRTSRIALMEFTHSTRHVFPRGGGMTEFDADSPASLAAEFESAVEAIAPVRRASTDIGTALHEAGNLLRTHGKPGNEKRIVLVSDGGDWRSKGDQSLGEVVQALQEPVSLMEHLYRDSGIRVHAVGISTPDLYRAWLAEDPRNVNGQGLSPDHLLLDELSRVGGGDAAAIGGLDVLMREFAELGAGTSRRVTLSGSAAIGGALSREASETLRELGERRGSATGAGTPTGPAAAGAMEDMAGRIVEEAHRANGEAERVLGHALFEMGGISVAVSRAIGQGDKALGQRNFIPDITQGFAPQCRDDVPRDLRPALEALKRCLDGVAEGTKEQVGDSAWRLEQVTRLAERLEELAGRLAGAPVRFEPGHRAVAAVQAAPARLAADGDRADDGRTPTLPDSGAAVAVGRQAAWASLPTEDAPGVHPRHVPPRAVEPVPVAAAGDGPREGRAGSYDDAWRSYDGNSSGADGDGFGDTYDDGFEDGWATPVTDSDSGPRPSSPAAAEPAPTPAAAPVFDFLYRAGA